VIPRVIFPGKVHELAQSLAEEISRRYPSAIANSPEPLVSPGRRAEILERVFHQARQFSQERRLGLIGRMRLGSALRWQLKEMGYDEKFIDLAAEHLATSVTHQR